MRERIARYIAEELLNLDPRDGRTIAADEDLLGSGLVDSLGIMSLVFFVEQEAALEIPPEDVTIENFQTIDAIDGYLARRRGDA